MKPETRYDVVVAGGGPAGSTAATYLARSGVKVLLVEKERFPRFHIGESLLPYNHKLFEEMGICCKLENLGFPVKRGAQFHISNGSCKAGFVFSEGRFTKHPQALQVERSVFDEVLLRHAAESGAKVIEETSLVKIQQSPGGVVLELSNSHEGLFKVESDYVVDATGRANLTGNQEGLRVAHRNLRKLSVFGHFTGVALDPGERAGDTVLVRFEDGWFWIIPIGCSKVSVGCVFDKSQYGKGEGAAGEAFWGRVNSSAVMKARLAKASLIGALHVTTDFSYRNSRLANGRVIRVGDAAGFIDPIFSSGVYLAMVSARRAALLLVDLFKRNGNGREAAFISYERGVLEAMDFYWQMVERFYTQPFMEILMHPHPRWGLAAAVNAMLAGDLEKRWELRWRLKLFHCLVWLQSRWAVAPKISYA